jgi:SAM-dependent methyltransferase
VLWEPVETDALIRPEPGQARVTTSAAALVRATERLLGAGARRAAILEPGLPVVHEAVADRARELVVVAPGVALPEADFDLVVAAHALPRTADPALDRALRFARRGLREGGVLALSVDAARREQLPAYLVPPDGARRRFEPLVAATLLYRLTRAGFQGGRVRRYVEGGRVSLVAFAVRRAFN